MRIAICDDEKEIRELYAGKIRPLYPHEELVQYQSGEELLMAGQKPDILLLDIQMPCRNGMDTARQLRRMSKEMVIIFVSALEEYVFQAFDVGAFHYLVKPLDDRKFAEVLARAVGQYEENREQNKNKGKELPSLVITMGGEHITVRIGDIVYAEVFDRKVILHTMDSDIEYYGKMKELEKKAGDDFFRPHRAYLVNFNYIRKYDATTIYLTRRQALMAKRNYHDFVKSYLRFNQKKTIYAAGGGRME
ncbi:MAG: LytTR family DNA-binding domain-containing protein [Lachnospiraceae bacterium]|nr:LytTR family DNA-binding domain-containing protein [Lachnospiraceae bacterium]